ncbi:uncharacterized protein [Panulirus ornatus]|uniref:uncharacterized protein n=1 Tax=Panulirus ornatus TaxID=150431 RepID=UPI003A895165
MEQLQICFKGASPNDVREGREQQQQRPGQSDGLWLNQCRLLAPVYRVRAIDAALDSPEVAAVSPGAAADPPKVTARPAETDASLEDTGQDVLYHGFRETRPDAPPPRGFGETRSEPPIHGFMVDGTVHGFGGTTINTPVHGDT